MQPQLVEFPCDDESMVPIDQQLLDAIHRRFDDLKQNVSERMDDLRETVENTAGSLATLAKEQSHGELTRERIEITVNAIQAEQARIRAGVDKFDVAAAAIDILRREFDAHCEDHEKMESRRYDTWKLVMGGTVIAGLAELVKWLVSKLTGGGN